MRDKNGQAYRMIGSMADVTSLFETRKELKRTEEQYQTLVEQASDGIFIANQSGKFIMVNSSGCKLSQYSLDELKQLTIYDLADEEELRQTPFRFEEMAGDYGVRSERKLKKKDGTTIDVEVNAKFLSDGRFLAFVRDITERRKAEQEILKAQRLADKLIDSLPGIFYFYDEAGNFIRWNKEFERVTGYSSEQIKEMHPTDFISNEEKDSALNAIDRIFTRGNHDVEANLITRKGLKIPYYFKASKINYEGRQCVVGSAIDISERKKSEDELRLSEQKYKLLFHNNPLPMIMISLPDLNIIDVNEASVTHYGYTREEFLSMPAIALRPPEEVPRFLESIKIKRDGVRYSGTWHHKKKDGTLIDVEVISHDIPYGNKPARLVLINDVTEKNKASAALNESLENIRNLTEHIQNIREEERTHIAREIHDELGQQLTVLKMDVSWLNRRIADSDESIKQKLKELSEMLDGTVKTVRRISSELRPSLLDDLGLVAAIDWSLKEFQKRSGIEIEFREPKEEWELGDSVKTGLFRILQESLTNVARHAEARKVKVHLNEKKGQIILSIEDDGKGFDKLETNSKKTLGILGMKERAIKMGGIYEINSLPGKGTIVTITVPVK
jgi:PAS domain S-box-containing protein